MSTTRWTTVGGERAIFGMTDVAPGSSLIERVGAIAGRFQHATV